MALDGDVGSVRGSNPSTVGHLMKPAWNFTYRRQGLKLDGEFSSAEIQGTQLQEELCTRRLWAMGGAQPTGCRPRLSCLHGGPQCCCSHCWQLSWSPCEPSVPGPFS